MPKHFITVDGTKFYCNADGELELKDGAPQEVPADDTEATEVDAESEAVEEVKRIVAAAVKTGEKDVAKIVAEAREAIADVFKAIGENATATKTQIADLANSKQVTIDVKAIAEDAKKMHGTAGQSFGFTLNTKADIEALRKATGVVDFTGDVVEPTRDPEVTRDPVRVPFIEDIASTTEVGEAGLRYVEVVTETGAPATTAELADMPEKDFEYEAFTAPLRKVGVVNKHSIELLLDAPQLASEIQAMLTEDLNVEVDNQLLNGDGAGQNLTGIMSRATVVDAAAIGAQAFDGANHFDVLRIAMTKVAQGGRGRFVVTHILLNPADTEVLDLTKDAQDRYVMPSFTTADGTRIKGALVIENVGVPAGEFVLGDFRKLKVGRQGGVRVDMTNSDGTDFKKGIMSISVMRRVCSYVRTNHSAAFQTGDFATIKAALQANV